MIAEAKHFRTLKLNIGLVTFFRFRSLCVVSCSRKFRPNVDTHQAKQINVYLGVASRNGVLILTLNQFVLGCCRHVFLNYRGYAKLNICFV